VGSCSLSLLSLSSRSEAARLESLLGAAIRGEADRAIAEDGPAAPVTRFLHTLNLAGLAGAGPQPLARIRVDMKPSLADSERMPVARALFRSIASGFCDLDSLVRRVAELQLSSRTLVSLFLDWILRLPLTHILHESVFEGVLAVMMEMGRLAHEEDVLYGRVEGPATECWALIVDACEQTPAIAQALVVLLIAKSIVCGGKPPLAAAPADSKSLSRSTRLAADICTACQLVEDAVRLAHLPHGLASQAPATQSEFFVAVSAFRASTARQLAALESVPDALVQHLLSLGLAPRHVSLLREGATAGGAGSAVPPAGDALLEEVLRSVGESFTDTIRPDLLAARAAWLLVGAWHVDRTRTSCLLGAAEFLKTVEDAFVVQRTVVAIWELHLRQQLASVVSLNEKVGKAIKERLCTKHFGIESDVLAETLCALVALFGALRASTDKLAAARAAARRDPKAPMPAPSFALASEERWCAFSSQKPKSEDRKEGEQSQFHAMLTAPWVGDVDASTVFGHELLSKLMFLVQLYDMKSVRVLSLFPVSDRERFFTPLQHAEEAWESFGGAGTLSEGDEEVIEVRRLFVPRVLSHVLHEVDAAAGSALKDRRVRDVLEMSKSLGVDQDWVHGTLATALYVCGFDADADEVLGLVSQAEQYTPLMVEVARLRAAQLVAEDTGAGGTLKLAAQLPTEVQQWITADDDPPLVKLYGEVRRADMGATLSLLARIQPLLPAGTAEQQRAQHLLEAFESVA
jgi:hypothetical protein